MESHTSSPPAHCYLQFAQELRDKIHKLSHIKGASKLERKIIAEIKFLKNLLRRTSKVQESHLKSSNLSHYAAIVHTAENLPGTVAILQPFSCPGKNESLIVDVVAGQGHIWVKVIARKAQALHLVWAGQGQFGERDLLRQSEDYLLCAKLHPNIYTTPDLYFLFYNNVTHTMAAALRDSGVKVLGHEVPVDVDVEHKLMNLHLGEEEEEDDLDLEMKVVEDDLETDCMIMNASKFFRSRDKRKETSYLSMNDHLMDGCYDKFQEQEKCVCKQVETVSKKREIVTACKMDDESLQLSNEISLSSKLAVQKAMSEGQTAFFTSTNTFCLGPEKESNVQGLASYTDCNTEEPRFISSINRKSIECDKKERSQSAMVVHHHSLPSPCKTYLSQGLTKVTLQEHEELLKPKASATLVTSTTSEVSDSVCRKQDVLHSSGSANYHLLMEELLGVIPDVVNSITDHSKDIINSITKVNLDITTLITLVSAVTHGHCNYVFAEKILTMQAEEERRNPVLHGLEQFMKGKELYACRSAVDDFKSILATLGGDGERQRAEDLLLKIMIIEDNPSQKALQLKNHGKIRNRSKIIFGTGDNLEAITMTANEGFLRSAKGQGASFAVFVHTGRALTEEKQRTATPV